MGAMEGGHGYRVEQSSPGWAQTPGLCFAFVDQQVHGSVGIKTKKGFQKSFCFPLMLAGSGADNAEPENTPASFARLHSMETKGPIAGEHLDKYWT